MKSIISYEIKEHGRVKIKLAELLKTRGITRNRLHTLTGVKYAVIDRYYKAEQVEMIDLDFLAKVCFTLDCRVEDILEYEYPQ